jgi:hypothetical protein
MEADETENSLLVLERSCSAADPDCPAVCGAGDVKGSTSRSYILLECGKSGFGDCLHV